MWWIWGPSNGYAIFLVVPPFTLWVLWHGFIAQRHKETHHRWFINSYFAEIPFRIVSTINIFTLIRWAVHQNPPAWASTAPNTISFQFSTFAAVKQAVVGYILLLVADVLLNLSPVRKFFRLQPVTRRRQTGYIISLALLAGIFYWFLDSIIYTLLAKNDLNFIDYFAQNIPGTNFTTRIIFIICSLIAGLITAKLILRQQASEITLHKIQKEAVTREALLSSLIQSIPDLIWLKDRNGVYLACNPRFEDFFGAKEADIIGRTDYDFVNKELADFFRMHDNLAMLKGSLNKNEEEITFASDGHRELLETLKTPMYTSSGELIGILGIGRDISERKILQEQLSQSQKMESVGRLAGGVAHDFNNMLSIILGNSELMLMDGLPENSASMEYILEIKDAAERSSELTKQLLAFARKQTISPQKLDLNTTVSSILKMLRRLIGEDIELQWHPGNTLWPIKMDTGQIAQILTNMCINARDAIINIGSITIETQNITVDDSYCSGHSDAVAQDYVMMAVSDTGCGMAKETQEHLFEPFYTTKSSGKGTGLGLATVYGIMKQNHGFINVYSEVENGSTFKLYFPRFSEGEKGLAKTSQDESQNIQSGSEKLLLVEDEPVILKITQIKLEQLGYTVYGYSNPTEAITACQQIGHIDLLITDVIMPEMNGKDLTREISSRFPGIKSLFMSGYTSDVIANHGILEEGLNFISKPFTLKKLSATVREILDS